MQNDLLVACQYLAPQAKAVTDAAKALHNLPESNLKSVSQVVPLLSQKVVREDAKLKHVLEVRLSSVQRSPSHSSIT